MHAYVRREWMERNKAEGRVGWRGSTSRRSRDDGEEQVEQQVEDDDEPVEVEVELEQLDEYLNGLLDLFVVLILLEYLQKIVSLILIEGLVF